MLDAQALQHVGKLGGLALHVAEGVALLLAVLADPDHGGLVAAARLNVAVDALMGLVQVAAGQPVELGVDVRPLKVLFCRVQVRQVGLYGHGLSGLLADGLVLHDASFAIAPQAIGLRLQKPLGSVKRGVGVVGPRTHMEQRDLPTYVRGC